MGSALLEHLDYLTADEQQELDAHLVALTTGVAMVRYQHDPIGFARDILGVSEAQIRWSLNPGYDAHQWDGSPDPLAQIAEALADWQDVGVESGTGTGKSFWLAVLILWFLASWENALAFSFAPKEDQLRLYIWKEIGKLWPKFQPHFPNATLTDLCIRMRGGLDETWAANGYSVGIKAGEQVSTKASGMHAEHMLLVYEETPGIPLPVIEAGENTCTAPHNLRVAIGNPNHQLDALHKFCTTPGVRHVRMSALDHPNVITGNPSFVPGAVSAASIAKRKLKYGEASPVYQSRVKGLSPEQASDALIRVEWLKRSAARYEARKQAGMLPKKVTGKGVDVANSEHGDRACIADFADNCLIRLDAFACPDAGALGRQVALEIQNDGTNPSNTGIDGVGVGASTVNECRRLKKNVQNLQASARPVTKAQKAPDGGTYEWAADGNVFRHLRDQMYWQTREDLRLDVLDMPWDDELAEELTTPTFEDEPRTIVMAKDDIKLLLGRSPDKADAVVMGNWVRHRSVPVDRTVPAKVAHRATPLQIKDGRLVAAKKEPKSIDDLLDAIERRSGRVEHRERLPRRSYK
jgi:hypothetical protein